MSMTCKISTHLLDNWRLAHRSRILASDNLYYVNFSVQIAPNYAKSQGKQASDPGPLARTRSPFLDLEQGGNNPAKLRPFSRPSALSHST